MKIGVDFREAYNSRGIGRYIKEMIIAISQIDTENEYLLYIDSSTRIKYKFPSNYKHVTLPYINIIGRSNFVFYEQFLLPIRGARDKVDILWCPGNTFPLFLNKQIRLFATIHDAIFYDSSIKPKYLYQKLGKLYRRVMINKGIKRIEKVFTVSNYSKMQLEELFNLNNVAVTHNKIERFKEKAEKLDYDTGLIEKLNIIPGEYLFTLSGDAKSKNLFFLLDFISKYDIGFKLVIAGVFSYKTGWISKFITERKLEDKVIFTGKVSDDVLMNLYKYCKVFLFVSKSEGFGIPILEAMCYSKPIIATNVTSIPEVLGKGGIYINTLDYERLYSIIQNLESNFNFDFIKEQKKQLNTYLSWIESAEIVLKSFIN